MINYNINAQDVTKFFNRGKFPAGEENIFIKPDDVDLLPTGDVLFIDKTLNPMSIGMKYDILNRAGRDRISLVLPYLPYSRQDRYTAKGYSFALKTFATFINSLGFHRVYTVDAHSDVSGVINNLVDLKTTKCLDYILDQIGGPVTILSPDAGATKKIYDTIAASRYNNVITIATATKHRDPRTGDIIGIEVPKPDPYYPVLVFDDICDGGRTFIEIAKATKLVNMFLYITHGVLSKPDVFDYYDTVYSTDTVTPQFDYNLHTLLINYTQRATR